MVKERAILGEEDVEFVKNIRDKNRIGGLGPVNKNLETSAKKKQARLEQENRRIEKELARKENTETDPQDSPSSDDVSANDAEFVVDTPREKRKQRKPVQLEFPVDSSWMGPSMLVADKNQISHRNTFELLAEVFKAGGAADLDEITGAII